MSETVEYGTAREPWLRCSKCGKWKPPTDFYGRHGRKSSACGDCIRPKKAKIVLEKVTEDTEKKFCLNCGKEITDRRPNTKYCDNRCLREYNHNCYIATKECDNNLSRGKIGAAHELMVSADLIKKGKEVFRAVSPSASCDLIAIDNGILKRIEVRTGARRKDKTINWPAKDSELDHFDILAIVLHTNEIYYFSKNKDLIEL